MSYPAGYQAILDLFGPDPTAKGNLYFFDPTSEGNPTGESPEKALRTAADFNKAAFAKGDSCVWKAGTRTQLTEKIRNNRALGLEGNPFYIGAYHMANGKPVHGLGGKPRPIIDGGDPATFDPYGAMSQAALLALVPPPDKNAEGTFKEGNLEGLFNWYQNIPYDLMLWVRDIATRYSGGRSWRFTQSTGGKARGLIMENCYSEGTMKQAVHLAGVYDFIIKAPRFCLSGVEFNYWNPASNRQACLGSKGTEGDPDTPVNGWYDDPLIWDGWSSEAVNSNSGNRAIGLFNGFAVDQGLYCYYLDRTADMLVGPAIAIRTDRPAFQDFTDGDHGRGSCAFEVQNEAHETSFDWSKYNTAEDFAAYQTHDAMVDKCIAIGFARSFGLQSQASTKSGATHEGRAALAGVYVYNGLSINPKVAHVFCHAGNNNDAYKLDPDNPPRVWGCGFIGEAPFVDRKEDQFADVFRGNYFDRAPPAELSGEAVIGGLEIPIADYDDLAVLMETDEAGHMNESQVVAFRAKVMQLLHPVEGLASPIPTAEVTAPPNYTRSEFEHVDLDGNPWGDFMPIGPYSEPADSGGNPGEPDNPDDLEARVAELEAEVATLDGRVSALEGD